MIKNFNQFFLVSFILIPIISIVNAYSCSGTNLTYDGISYCLYTNNTMSSGDAETFCNGDGTDVNTHGHLVAIHSAFVNRFFMDKLAQYQIPEIWLGADSDIEWADRGGFMYWNDDTSFDYNNLVNGYCCKGVYCLSMNSTDGQWYPIPIASCNQQQLPFICQPPKK